LHAHLRGGGCVGRVILVQQQNVHAVGFTPLSARLER
jgi:hypothetical protein